jgi:hypothetical protein
LLTKCDAIIESEIIAAEIIFSRFLSNGERYFFDCIGANIIHTIRDIICIGIISGII